MNINHKIILGQISNDQCALREEMGIELRFLDDEKSTFAPFISESSADLHIMLTLLTGATTFKVVRQGGDRIGAHSYSPLSLLQYRRPTRPIYVN